MDPFLERHWSGVHHRLTTYVADALSAVLPADLRAVSEERVLLEETNREGVVVRASRQPDVGVTEVSGSGGVAVTSAPPVLIPAPFVVEFDEPVTERWVEIRDAANGDRLVTAVEILSPGNKASGTLNDRYRRKIGEYARAGVNVVEVDLLRGSRARLRVTEAVLPARARAAYLVCVRRAGELDRWEIHPISLRAPIPAVPVPLRPTDGDVRLDLQPLIDRVYEVGRYGRAIDYAGPPDPPLDADDEAWADALLRGAGLR